MNLFKRKSKNSEVKGPVSKYETRKIYEDASGRSWFEYTDKMNIPATRSLAAEVATRFADMNITKDKLKGLILKMKENANEGNVVSLFSILQEIEFRLDFVGEEETLIEIASIYFLLEDEPEQLSASFQERKKQIFKEDPDCRAFFLSRVFQLITNYSQLSEVDFLKYLKANQEAAERILRFLPAK